MGSDGRIWVLAALAGTVGLSTLAQGSRGIVRRGLIPKVRDNLYYLQSYELLKGGKIRETGFVHNGQRFPATQEELSSFEEQQKHRTLLNCDVFSGHAENYQVITKEDFFRLPPETRGMLNLGLAIRAELMEGAMAPVDSSPLLWRSIWKSTGRKEDNLKIRYLYELSPGVRWQRVLFNACVREPGEAISALLQEELQRAE